MFLLSLCLLVLPPGDTFASFNPYPRHTDMRTNGKDVGDRILITPYVESGKIDEIRNLTKVKSFIGNVNSYAGFVTVDKECDSNLFFWFFPADSDPKSAPVSVWLQGGPGASSLYGLFEENGPFSLTTRNELLLRKYSWTKVSSYVYIDNPVGTGFSYAKSEECYSKNQVQVGKNLLSAVKQILQMFPEIKSNPLYVTGESYGGKYVPALAYAIHKDEDAKHGVNLKGIAIGNGLVDPYHQLIYSEYLYYLGLIDERGRVYMKKEEDQCRDFITKEKWMDAFVCFDNLLNGDTVNATTYFHNVTGFSTYFNYLYPKGEPESNISAYVNKDGIRAQIHVGDATYHDGTLVEKYLMEDVMKSVRPWLEELLEHYKVLIYNGQLDIIVGYPLTLGYLKELNWSGAEEYKAAKRHIWRVNDDVAGYVKTAGHLTEVLVRNAGHMVPKDQPKWSIDLISRFINGKSFH